MQARRLAVIFLLGCCLYLITPQIAIAQENSETARRSFKDLVQDGGYVGFIILGLSVAMIALIFEHLLSIRRTAMMPHGLAEETHRLVGLQQYAQAEQQCKLQPSFLGYLISSGLAEVEMGYSAVEKAVEDASMEQAARLFRKIEYLSVIGTLAPMLGLLGTVWGMIQAFMEFEAKANPQVSELAPGIYRALITTFLGLSVAVPALAAFAIFRNRVDELVAESTLMAEHVFTKYKRTIVQRRARQKKQVETGSKIAEQKQVPAPPVPAPPITAPPVTAPPVAAPPSPSNGNSGEEDQEEET